MTIEYNPALKEDRLLTPKQMAFVREYVADATSVTKAAIRAGYSIHTANESGSRLMTDSRVKKLIQEANSLAVQTLGLSAERVLQELWKVAGANPGDTVELDSDGEATLNPKGAGEVSVTSVSGNGKKVRSVTTKTVKPADKIAALEKIAKIMNLFPKEDKTVEVNLSLTELIEKSMAGEVSGKTTAEVSDGNVS